MPNCLASFFLFINLTASLWPSNTRENSGSFQTRSIKFSLWFLCTSIHFLGSSLLRILSSTTSLHSHVSPPFSVHCWKWTFVVRYMLWDCEESVPNIFDHKGPTSGDAIYCWTGIKYTATRSTMSQYNSHYILVTWIYLTSDKRSTCLKGNVQRKLP